VGVARERRPARLALPVVVVIAILGLVTYRSLIRANLDSERSRTPSDDKVRAPVKDVSTPVVIPKRSKYKPACESDGSKAAAACRSWLHALSCDDFRGYFTALSRQTRARVVERGLTHSFESMRDAISLVLFKDRSPTDISLKFGGGSDSGSVYVEDGEELLLVLRVVREGDDWRLGW